MKTEVDDKVEDKIDNTLEDKVKDAPFQYQKHIKNQMRGKGDAKLA